MSCFLSGNNSGKFEPYQGKAETDALKKLIKKRCTVCLLKQLHLRRYENWYCTNKASKRDIERNLDKHLKFINNALEKQPDLLMFPELSLTGYEPELARSLAIHSDDSRLTPLQEISNQYNIILCVGAPTINNDDLFISMIIFHPYKERVTYSKQYLYPSEEGIFTAGHTPCIIPYDEKNRIAPAICYELSNSEHALCTPNECNSLHGKCSKLHQWVECEL